MSELNQQDREYLQKLRSLEIKGNLSNDDTLILWIDHLKETACLRGADLSLVTKESEGDLML